MLKHNCLTFYTKRQSHTAASVSANHTSTSVRNFYYARSGIGYGTVAMSPVQFERPFGCTQRQLRSEGTKIARIAHGLYRKLASH